jgi:hypothetical protein
MGTMSLLLGHSIENFKFTVFNFFFLFSFFFFLFSFLYFGVPLVLNCLCFMAATTEFG